MGFISPALKGPNSQLLSPQGGLWPTGWWLFQKRQSRPLCWNSALEHKQNQDSLDDNVMFRLFPGLGHTLSFLGIIFVFALIVTFTHHHSAKHFAKKPIMSRSLGHAPEVARRSKPTRTLGWRNVMVLGARGVGHEHSWKAAWKSQVEKELTPRYESWEAKVVLWGLGNCLADIFWITPVCSHA